MAGFRLFMLFCAMAAALSAAPATAQTKTFRIMDNQGFSAPMVAFTLEIPQDWEVSGQVLWQKPCSSNEMYETVLTARSPDGLTGVRLMPGYQIIWNDVRVSGQMDPYSAQLMQAQVEAERNQMRTQFQGSNCHVALVTSADQIFRSLILPTRPADTRILKQVPNEAVRSGYAKAFGPQQPGFQAFFDAQTIELGYAIRGQQVIETLDFNWYMFQTEISDPGMYLLNQVTIVEPPALQWVAAHRRAADEAILKQIGASLRIDPDWQRRIEEVQRKAAESRRQQTAETNAQREINRKNREIQNDLQHQRFLQLIQQ